MFRLNKLFSRDDRLGFGPAGIVGFSRGGLIGTDADEAFLPVLPFLQRHRGLGRILYDCTHFCMRKLSVIVYLEVKKRIID